MAILTQQSVTKKVRVLRAQHLGMCFGVRDAINLAYKQAQSAPLTILGDLVHNQRVLDDLQDKGIRLEKQLEQVDTPNVMITAHGTSQRMLDQVKQQQFQVTEATCPLVHFAHRQVARLVRDGYHPVIVGKRNHVEVKGITDDLEDYDVVLTEEDVARLQPRPRFGVAAQTTQPIERVRHLVSLIRQRFPDSEVRFADTVCRPTKDRQKSAIEMAKEADIVIVVGGATSNNTHELVRTCQRFCSRVHHVQRASELQPDWFTSSDNTVGLTAGTSTPDATIDEVEQWLRELEVSCD